MKSLGLALCTLIVAAAEPKISFTKSFPGSVPAVLLGRDLEGWRVGLQGIAYR